MNNDIRALVNDFTTQLSALIRRTALEQVMAALGGGSPAPARRGPGRPKGSTNAAPKATRGGKRVRRSPEDLARMSDAILNHVRSNPGQRGEIIATALGTDVGTMRKPMLALVAAKKVSTKGQRRGMTYHAGGSGIGMGSGGGKAKRGGKRGKK